MSLSVKDILELCEGLRERGCVKFQSPEFSLDILPATPVYAVAEEAKADEGDEVDPDKDLYWSAR